MKAVTLCSGSSGNATFLTNGQTHILVDCGLSLKRLSAGIACFGLRPENLDAVLLTHEHTDHTSALKVWGRLEVPVYGTEGTLSAVKSRQYINDARAFSDSVFNIGGITVRAFNTCHDAEDSCGYVFSMGNTRIGVCTDLGEITNDVLDALCGCEYVILECNHDIHMLKNGPYPLFLRRRVLSRLGHLCNDDCAEAVVSLAKTGLKRVSLAHMSEQNNDPSLALGSIMWALNEYNAEHNVQVDVAPRYEAGIAFAV
jgi:phosphoribosyl 1,2-cyclic phosphodiesterase